MQIKSLGEPPVLATTHPPRPICCKVTHFFPHCRHHARKRCPPFAKTTAVVLENDRTRFRKRLQWFQKTTALVFWNDRTRFVSPSPHANHSLAASQTLLRVKTEMPWEMRVLQALLRRPPCVVPRSPPCGLGKKKHRSQNGLRCC